MNHKMGKYPYLWNICHFVSRAKYCINNVSVKSKAWRKHEISKPAHGSALKKPTNISWRSLSILIHHFLLDHARELSCGSR